MRLLAPLAADLSEWRIAQGRPAPDALVFPSLSGGAWSDDAWRYWRRRIFGPAARAAGLENARPYDLRHSFVSLLLAEGANVVEVARQAGHSPTMTLSTYAHLFEELDGPTALPPRTGSGAPAVPDSYPKPVPASPTQQRKRLQILKSRRADSNRGPLHYE